jgi:hypothetical protein
MNAPFLPARLVPQHPDAALQVITDAAERRLAFLLAGRNSTDLRRVATAAGLLDRSMPGRAYHDLPEGLSALAAGDPHFPALLAALLLAKIRSRRVTRAVPDTVIPELSRQALRILAQDAPSLDDDAFRKDLSICLLLSFPCVAQVVEESGGVPRRAVLSGTLGQALRVLRHFASTGWPGGPYLEIHTHTPMLDGFTPAGWERCYELTADLLRLRPDCQGLVGGSWFYDPELAEISPRLSYLADTPLAGGAFRVRLGCSAADTDLATATSPSRRRLVAEGRYTPTRWLLIWPRAALLAWVDARKGGV